MELEEAKELLRGKYGEQLLRAACDYVFPIYWSIRRDGKWEVQSNGSGFVLGVGAEPFVVTAAHVYESYLEARKSAGGEIEPQCSDVRFRFEERVIGYLRSEVLDIATFRITEHEIGALKRSVLTGSQKNWPPAPPQRGVGALFAGFPGLQRIDSPDVCNFGFYASLTPVSAVNDRYFGCVFERESWIDSFKKGLPPEGYDLGGMSGAPALVIEESEAGLVSWRPGGVVFNASNTIGEIVLIHHAKFIASDGTLNAPEQ